MKPFVVIILALAFGSAWALPVQVQNIGGWKYQTIAIGDPDPFIGKFSGGAAGSWTLLLKDSEVPITVFLYNFPVAGPQALELGTSTLGKIAFSRFKRGEFKVLEEKQRILNGRRQYYALYSSQAGLQKGILMAVDKGDVLQVFNYENFDPAFEHHVSEVKKLFQNLKI